jgi:hypothetical protein
MFSLDYIIQKCCSLRYVVKSFFYSSRGIGAFEKSQKERKINRIFVGQSLISIIDKI